MSHLLQKAAEQGDTARINQLLDQGADIEWRHKGTGRTALVSATIADHRDAVATLLDRGANIDARCVAMGYTSLAWAAGQGQAEIVDLLTARGASLDIASPEMKRTALMAAAQAGHAGIVRHLLARGANPDLLDFQQLSAWSLAAENHHQPVLDVLQAAGVDAPPPPVEPASLPWPDMDPEILATQDPARVVRAYTLAVYAWEKKGHEQAPKNIDPSDPFWAEPLHIVEAFCTEKKRVMTRMSWGWPPEFTPDVMLTAVEESGARAEVVLCDPPDAPVLRYEHRFLVRRAHGEWRIDTLKNRLYGTEDWEKGFL